MMSFLQTGKALYVLAAICLAGVFSRLMAGSFYKGLIKESTNLALTKNKYLRNLKQSAEDTYRINQGMNNTRVYLERQIYGLRMLGLSVRGLDNLSGQLTLLCFLAGGGAAFLSYWYRSDNYYIVLYGTVGILAGMFTMLVDYGVNLEAKRQQLLTCLQDYMENVMWPRLNREGGDYTPAAAAEGEHREPAAVRSIGRERRFNNNTRRGLEQAAASRENSKEKKEDRSGENWLQDLNPDQKRMLGELLKEFIS
ncbi:hypothetical protein [Lacrimispora sp. 210928-DFI.3.58]|uniref:hypothetical protein n=1 Tax=Lacrimispora sp. 210928-DFI.3.58 TaxID=2883214 RepID=UPI001D0923DA|nr:hypothetical protein [Lacrimispora sp. 210928-DFI.3.58]MCB7318148.1 hypothetical protein [Lacrimispora sp. 210928-DFI.3.58]